MSQSILFVDDERSILRSLERLFLDEPYILFTAESAEEGLRILAETPMDLVISDMRMPGMDGHQFLKRVKAMYPGTTRLILSGYADEGEILHSLIDGSNALYLFKPWDNAELKTKVRQIFAARQIYRNPALLKLVNGLGNLSMVAGMYKEVEQLIENDAEVTAVAKVIQKDPAVTAAVLRIANSAYYNVRTGSVTQALLFLGLPVVLSIVLSCSLLNLAQKMPPPLTQERLTRQSCLTNVYVTAIYSEFLDQSVPENLASMGLLHNLGMLVGFHYFPEEYRKVLADCSTAQEPLSLCETEKREIGVNHCELGGYLLDLWGIPYPTVECTLFQREPQHPAILDREAVAVIHAASYYAWREVAPALAGNLDEKVFSTLGFTRRKLEERMPEWSRNLK